MIQLSCLMTLIGTNCDLGSEGLAATVYRSADYS